MLNKVSFTLDPSFIDEYSKKTAPWGPLGYFVYKRTYSRRIEGSDRTEEWFETVRRVVEGTYSVQKSHCAALNLEWLESKAQRSAQKMYDKIFNMKFLPPGRGLWAMGTDMIWEKGSAALNNCAFISTENIDKDPAEPFCFLMDMSMLGVGVGSDTKGRGKAVVIAPSIQNSVHTIPDTREGWVEIVRIVISSYFKSECAQPKEIDFSQIRPHGDLINGFGGVASGPEPLERLVENIKRVLDARIGEPIRSADIVDLHNYIGKCVVAGNVRRTAEIMFGELDDQEFLDLKTDMDALGDRRWASNNSVFAKEGMDYESIASRISINGEPGFIFLDNAKKFGRLIDGKDGCKPDTRIKGTNPCGEQFLESYELCNLVETFPARHDSLEEYLETLKFAYLYGKSVTLVPTHNPKTNAVMMRNRRIGVGMSGIVQHIDRVGQIGLKRWADTGYKTIREYDKMYSEWLCVREAIRVTTVKPSGTVSLLCGATPGIHFDHSEYYIRNIRVPESSPMLEPCRAAGYPIEPCAYQPGSMVVSFPVKSENFSRSKDQVSIWEQIGLVALMQTYWSDNSVSSTITFSSDEAGEIPAVMSAYEDELKSVSFLPVSDHGYKQAPYIAITESEYLDMASKITPLEVKDGHEVEDKFCDGDTCLV